MPEPIKKIQTSQPAPQQLQKTQKSGKQQEQAKVQKNDPSIGRLLLNRAGAVVLTPIAAVAGALTIVSGGIYGAVNPKKTFEQGMQEGIKAAGQGADMLDSMWNGRYF